MTRTAVGPRRGMDPVGRGGWGTGAPPPINRNASRMRWTHAPSHTFLTKTMPRELATTTVEPMGVAHRNFLRQRLATALSCPRLMVAFSACVALMVRR